MPPSSMARRSRKSCVFYDAVIIEAAHADFIRVQDNLQKNFTPIPAWAKLALTSPSLQQQKSRVIRHRLA